MSEPLTCYFSVMRYVSDVVRDESINVGVVLFEPKVRLLFMRPLTGLSHVQNLIRTLIANGSRSISPPSKECAGECRVSRRPLQGTWVIGRLPSIPCKRCISRA